MGLFDSIKKTASNAVNAVTGNSAKPQQAPQPVQNQQPIQQTQPVANQPAEPQSTSQTQVSVDPQGQVSANSQPLTNPPKNADPNTFFGKEYRGSGIGAGAIMKSTWFFEDYLQYGNEKIPYSDLTEIQITHMASRLTNGEASTLQRSTNRELSLTFNTYVLGFEKGVDYANEKIAEASGALSNRKFKLRSQDASKLEVFEDYISINRQGGGLSSMMGTNDSTEIIMISDISNIDASNGTQLAISYTNDNGVASQSAFSYRPEDANTINEIISFVRSYVPEETDEAEEETWKLVTGSVREFPLLGKTLTINEKLDVYNAYRTMYMKCASHYTDQMKNKYQRRINNFDSFMRLYLPLYKEYLEKLINKTADILVSAGIWTETSESVMERHIGKHQRAIEDYATMYESLQATVQNNKSSMEALTSFIPNLVGGGFGLSGAVKGIATATAFNLVRDGAESALINNMNISSAQKAELYGRIDQQTLFDRAFMDMWSVYSTLIEILNENGKDIWIPSDSDSAKADNIMKNISNPNFPQEQFPDVMVAVIGMNPYKRSIYELLRSRGANESEVTAISEFFGYTNTTPDCVE